MLLSEPVRMLRVTGAKLSHRDGRRTLGAMVQADRFWVRSEVLHEMKFKPIDACLSSVAIPH